MWQRQRFDDRDPERGRYRTRSIVGAIVQSLPAAANDALSALLIACAVWLAMLVVPRIVALRADAEAAQARIEANENRASCASWGLAPGSRNHTLCTRDLDRIRAGEQAGLLARRAAIN